MVVMKKIVTTIIIVIITIIEIVITMIVIIITIKVIVIITALAVIAGLGRVGYGHLTVCFSSHRNRITS